MKSIKVWGILLCVILLTIEIKPVMLRAAGFEVSYTSAKHFYVGESLSVDTFQITYDGVLVKDKEEVVITPSFLEKEGEQEVSIKYYHGEDVYYQVVTIMVEQIVPSSIELGEGALEFIDGEEVVKERLPQVYVCFNNGTRELVSDYTYVLDWEAKTLLIAWGNIEESFSISVVENYIKEVQVLCLLDNIEEGYCIRKRDLVVTAVFANGRKVVVTEYELLPYVLSSGKKSILKVQYQNIIGSVEIYTMSSSELDTSNNDNWNENIGGEAIEAATEMWEGTPLEGTQQQQPEIVSVLDFHENRTEKEAVYYTRKEICVEIKGGVEVSYQWVSIGEALKKEWIELESTRLSCKKENKGYQICLRYKEAQGEYKELWSTPFYIDTKEPTLNIKSKVYQKNQKIVAKDKGSGIDRIAITGDLKKQIKNGESIKKEGKFLVEVCDRAGNTTKVAFEIKKPAKKLKVTYEFLGKQVIGFKGKVEGTSRKVLWKSSNKKVGTITKEGKFTAKGKGSCWVTAKIDHLKVKKKVMIQKQDKHITMFVYD